MNGAEEYTKTNKITKSLKDAMEDWIQKWCTEAETNLA